MSRELVDVDVLTAAIRNMLLEHSRRPYATYRRMAERVIELLERDEAAS